MIDDDDAKVRRNLLVFSVLVLAAEWFNLHLGELITQALKLKAQLDPLKLCAAALAILVYLALRYKDARLVGDQRYRDVINDELLIISPKVARAYAQFMMEVYKWTGLEAPIFHGGLKDFVKQRASQLTSMKFTKRPTIWLSLGADDVNGEAHVSGFENQWTMNAKLRWNSPEFRGSVISAPLLVEARGIHYLLIWSYSRVWWLFFCETAIRARLPVLLGTVAVAILVSKVVSLLAAR